MALAREVPTQMVPIGDTFARTGDVQFDYPRDVVFRALTEVLPRLKGFKIIDINATARHVNVATAVSAWSWGERVTVSVVEVGPNKAAMGISSATKTLIGSATSHSKNRKNVELLIRATSDELERSGATWIAELAPSANGPGEPAPPLPDSISGESRLGQLKTLGELRDSGVLTTEEFDAEKARIMGTSAPPSGTVQIEAPSDMGSQPAAGTSQSGAAPPLGSVADRGEPPPQPLKEPWKMSSRERRAAKRTELIKVEARRNAGELTNEESDAARRKIYETYGGP